MANDGGPALYTVEEAARLLRVGRTKAYAMTQEWRATGGRSGLPVVAFGNVLRVPRAALERVLGVDLCDAPVPPPDAPPPAAPSSQGQAALVDDESAAQADTEPAPAPRQATRPAHQRTARSDQLDLFVAS